MTTLATRRTAGRELSPEQVADVKAELASVLESDSFASSQRCRDFLECVVELTLKGDRESLTERFLGVRLFGRSVDYETATDSIVRVRANDVRRRLMQFYSTSHAGSKVHIELAAGRYIPEFHWLSDDVNERDPAQKSTSVVRTDPALQGRVTTTVELASGPHRRWWSAHPALMICMVILVAALCGAFFIPRSGSSKNFNAFWQPVLNAPGQPVLNLPTTDTFQLTMNPGRTLSPLNDLQPGQSMRLTVGDFIGFHDWHVSLPVLQATLSVASALERRGKTPLVRIGTDLRRDELRGHPVIAIGSFSNPWAEASVSGLRFTFDRGASDREAPRIRDSQNALRSWSLPHTYPEPQGKDYAIVTRTFDPVTGEPFVSLAGLHSFGNQIAGEFVSQERSWDEVARRAPSGWKQMNLQILLEADVIGTTPGSPRIVDLYFWK